VSTVGWAVIGTGGMADGIASAIRATPHAELVAVVGRTPEAARAFGGRHGVEGVHHELAVALGNKVDAVYVGSPNALHAEHAGLALEAGKHVLCDKPLATDFTEAQVLCSVAERKGLALSVNLQVRHHPGIARVRGWLSEGTIGRLVAVRASIAFGTEELMGWRAVPELAAAAALYNLGIHAVDSVLALVEDRPASVSCVLRPAGTALDRTALMTVTFAGGVVASILASQELSHDDVRMDLLGTSARVMWDGWMAPYRGGRLVLRRNDGKEIAEDAECPDAYQRVVRGFTDAILAGGAATPSPAEALQTVRVVEAARSAARLQSVVAL
jgi:1,5-anhydro-D-fructose reductase (1,5-anhydro-D-mannitol-forming)